ncbi:unnamed protein product [Nyctereutes procyonoides]|uniref:(raccoon dog) hypothetical protein n=1 Tax=Nyctereutes procyonoides TaxID=34880 RepID=A0A811ZJI7_NYCPR|nr:unnamed protein product [Nyctereutes procyonoides]
MSRVCRSPLHCFFGDEEGNTGHVLALTMLCFTEGAKDKCDVIEVMAQNHDQQKIAVLVTNLRLSCQLMLSWVDFQLQPPITFCLKSNFGPMYNDVSEEESKEEGSKEVEAELSPILPAKKQGHRPLWSASCLSHMPRTRFLCKFQ